jgi:hypothetical protein
VTGVDEAEFSEPVTRLARWRRSTASGVILTGVALGLRDALELEKEPPGIVQEVPGGKPDLEAMELYLDFDHPEYTVAVVRPWLLGGAR